MDSKVLESLMIPEYEIANEGLGSKLKEITNKIFRFITQIINTIIRIISNLINKFKHGKTIHNDKETYQKARALSNKYYDDLCTLIVHLPDSMGLMMTKTFSLHIYGIREPEKDVYNKYINTIDREYEIYNQKFISMKNDVKDNKLYFTEYEHNTIIERLEQSKDRMEHIASSIKKSIDEEVNTYDFDRNNKTEDESIKQQKRINEFMKYISKYQSLFGNIQSFVISNVSSDIITDNDRYKYEE